MYYELALMSVLVAGGYWGWYFLRHELTRTYGMMQLAAAALSGLGLLGRKLDVGALGIAGAIGVGGGTCLLVLGPLTRAFARRMAAAERFGIAQRMLDLAEILAPGSGVSDEKALLGAMREIRDGNIEQTVDALTAAKDRAPAEARLAIDERIAMLYLAAYRWDDAIAHAEANLFGALPAEPAEAGGQVGLRRALGIAPPVWVELLGAYGYKGDLDRAATMLARLEDVCAGRDDAAMWLHRGRMIFLALAGRVGAVQTLVEPRRSRHMNPAARTYWIAVAHERRGDSAAAELAYAKARARSRGRPRVLIDQALARLAATHDAAAKFADVSAAMMKRGAQLGPAASELVARVEAAPPPTVVQRARPRGPWATRLLTFALVAVAAAIALFLGDSSDVGVLMRGGAMVRGVVRAGEWWRLVACIFVHVGGVHLALNAVGLWFIGRLAEDLFGAARVLAIFALAGVAGAVASFLASPAGVSAGASGAIFGLLGAVFVELTVQRKRHRAAWSRGMWGSLAVVTVAEVAIGFVYPVIDQWAHGAGLVVGALCGLVMSPYAKWGRLALQASRAIAIVFAGAAILAAVQVVRTPLAASLGAGPHKVFVIDGVTARAPASWQASTGQLYDPDGIVIIFLERQPLVAGLPSQLALRLADEPRRARDEHFDKIDPAPDRSVPFPPGWEGSELAVSAPLPDPVGGRQHYRVVAVGRAFTDCVVFASLYIPETIARDAPEFFNQLLADSLSCAHVRPE